MPVITVRKMAIFPWKAPLGDMRGVATTLTILCSLVAFTATVATATTSDPNIVYATDGIEVPDDATEILNLDNVTLTPTSTPIARWHVRNPEGKICMLMGFNGTITYYPEKGNFSSVWISEDAFILDSKCTETISNFTLRFPAKNMMWQMSLNFTKTGSLYELVAMSALLYNNSGLIASGQVTRDLFEVPIESYFSCDSFNRSAIPFNLNLTMLRLQPFALDTANHDLGKEFSCNETVVTNTTAAATTVITTLEMNTTTLYTTVNTTTQPANLTTSNANTTTGAPTTVNTTNGTTPITNAITTSELTTVNTTTTLVTSNGTMPTPNMTTHSNFTTSAITTATLIPTLTPIAKWDVRDHGGKICMLMDFNGTIMYYPPKGDNILVWIPQSANISKSICKDKIAKFVLEFDAQGRVWQMSLNFTNNGSSYKLGMIATSLYKDGRLIDAAYQERDFFVVPTGSYYSCNSFNQSVSPFMLNMTTPVFQPFVQRTESGRDLGKEFVCGSGGSSSNGAKIAVGVVVSLVIVVVAVVVTYCLVKRRRAQKPSYSTLD